MRELANKTPTEIKTCTFNFAPDLGTTNIVPASSVFTATLVSTLRDYTVDIGAATLDVLGDQSQVVGQSVLVLIGGGMNGNKYQVLCETTCSDGQRLDLAAQFLVTTSAA